MRFRVYGLVEAFVVVLVVLLFRNLDRKTASMIATGMFILVPTAFLILEFRFGDYLKKILFYIAHLQFLILFAVPILYLNFIASPIDAFNPPMILGLTMAKFHQYSNYSYFLTAFSCFVTSFLANRRGD
ncbi:MAG: hypothetical protein ACK5P5_10210 [Pseudobdellovibrionaceae bacterium]